MKEIFTETDYVQILQAKINSKDVQFVSSEWQALDSIEGFMGDHYTLKINYKLDNEQKSENFFIKTRPTKTEIQRSMANKFNVYDKEIFLYEFLMKEFEKLNYPTNFAAKSYYCKKGETIVMEDLKLRDFQLFNRNKFYDMDHCKLALRSLANYHANAMSYEEQKSKELGQTYRLNDDREDLFNEIFFIPDNKDGEGAKFIQKTCECYIELTKIMPVSQQWRSSFEERIKKLDLPEIFSQQFPYRKTACHGDLWSNNMMFRYENGVPKECCLLDFQLLRHHYPSFDAILVIYSNTSRDFRKKYMNDLLDYYYDSFEVFLDQNGYKASSIFPKEHFLKVAEALKAAALFQGASTRTLTQLPKDVTSDAVNAGGNDLEDLYFEDKRIKLILEGCRKDDIFKDIMFDDIYDLNECI